ncbi:orotidine 5'-phosphate decarboxylase [Candidatus Saccharibacteria bacterium RIFCSPHIGHO2_01_FULL_45_15]|nr:MAG: orotidine 5'-phosphate decarboxylase [Candidatus Saccharibacteria bacterium RIFCSPHIGHO2_01_FULL_45_15]OGL28739.1 MAG: orotidine 5'-phosphate decarboxylase [Candidatus Saccharibacteria bacterium RIFCSPHIGHO2_02_FULL_46_12]OGL31773.1 MAG: orotidine 5'-phosphate decarboxylase [Candidatus Saccharibacteria bacterium RIFCSPHIGHO2_12_FULL_44_22]
MTSFNDMLQAKFDEGKSVCVGLDPDITKLPLPHLSLNPQEINLIENWQGMGSRESAATAIVRFNERIVDATCDLVCAYKPNSAFYERIGWNGMRALERTVAYIRRKDPTIPIIYDAKRGDIGNTNAGYAELAFDVLGVDAITIAPYMGSESLSAFMEYSNKGIIVLVRTSNPGAGEFQDLDVEDGKEKLYETVARHVAEKWNGNGNCAVVVGATKPEDLASVRKAVGDMPILIPGIGAQGGDLEATVSAGANSQGQGMIINSSRGVIHASRHGDFTQAARKVVEVMNAQIAEVLTRV